MASMSSEGKVLRGLEGAVAVAEQHAGLALPIAGVVVVVDRRQVERAVAVEVRDRKRFGVAPGVKVFGGLEAAVAVTQQHADSPRE